MSVLVMWDKRVFAYVRACAGRRCLREWVMELSGLPELVVRDEKAVYYFVAIP